MMPTKLWAINQENDRNDEMGGASGTQLSISLHTLKVPHIRVYKLQNRRISSSPDRFNSFAFWDGQVM